MTTTLRILIMVMLALSASLVKAQMPEIPSTLRTPAERAAYLTVHFWDNVGFDNPADLQPEGPVEQHFSNFISIFDHTDSASIAQGFKNLIGKAAKSGDDASAAIADLAEKYLFEVESPVHSDKYFLIYASESPLFTSPKISKERIEYMSKVASSNTPGCRGEDFTFINGEQKVDTLCSVLNAAPLNILVLYDPECDHCNHTISALRYNWAICNAIDKGFAQIILIYPEGDKEVWQSHLPAKTAKGFIYGFAPEWLDENGDEYYYLRSTPTLYLLDSSGTVLNKDATADELIAKINDYTTTH
ncbi:MAG: DUF5106 domain-containing protein [Muribaculaceae bacterium]|nr:DUF5106 domain-containing protein [Muribaculaceae bacterium]